MTDDLLSSVGDGIERSITNQTENMAQTLGRWCSTFLSNTPYVMEWRFNNLVKVSNKFDHLCNAQGIPKDRRNEVSKKFGVLWLDGASLEEDDLIQELWAKILAEEAKVPESQSINMINILKNMRASDAKAFQLACSLSLSFNDDRFIPIFNKGSTQTLISEKVNANLYSITPALMGQKLAEFEQKISPDGFFNEIEKFIPKGQLIKLDSLGLINISANFQTTLREGDKLKINKKEIHFERKNSKLKNYFYESFTIPSFFFTQDGNILSNLIKNNKESQKIYINDLITLTVDIDYFRDYILKNLEKSEFTFVEV